MKTKLSFLLLSIVLGIFPLHASFEVEKEKPRGEEDHVSKTEANTTAAAVNTARHVPARDGGTTTALQQDEGGDAAASLEQQQQSPARSVASRNRRDVTPRRERPPSKEVFVEDRAALLAVVQSTLSDNVTSYVAVVEKANRAKKALHEVKQRSEGLLREYDRKVDSFNLARQHFEIAERNVGAFQALKVKTRRPGFLYNISLQEREWARIACQVRGRLVKDAKLALVRNIAENKKVLGDIDQSELEMASLRKECFLQREFFHSELDTAADNVERALGEMASDITEARRKFNSSFIAAEDSKRAALEAVHTKDDFNEEDTFKENFGDPLDHPEEMKKKEDEAIGAVKYEMKRAFGEEHYQHGEVNSDFSDEENEEEVAATKASYEEMAEYAEEKLSQLSGFTGAQKIVTQLYVNLREYEKEITIQEQHAIAPESSLVQAMLETMHVYASIKPFQEDEILGTVTHLDEYNKLTTSWKKATAAAEAMQRSWEDVSKAVENYRKARLHWGMSMVHLIMTFKQLANPHEFLSVSVEARDAEFVGRLWVGDRFSVRKNNRLCLVSNDGLRQYCAPSLNPYKKKGNIAKVAPQEALQGVNILANYKWKGNPNDSEWEGDIHLSITDVVTKEALSDYQKNWAERYPERSLSEAKKEAFIREGQPESDEREYVQESLVPGYDFLKINPNYDGDDLEEY